MSPDPASFRCIEGPIKVGLLGAARIAPPALTRVAQGLVELSAVAARDPARARAFAQAEGIPVALANYEALLRRADIDVVYIALPSALHALWVERALLAGKHVLVEKPFGLGVQEAERCVALAAQRRLLLMEAHHWRYHPLAEPFQRASARVGMPRRVSLGFQAPIPHGDIRLEPSLGAGVLLDFGCYLAQWQQLVTGDPSPRVVLARAIQATPGVEVAVQAELETSDGTRVELHCDMRPQVSFRAFAEVSGPRGRVLWENPLVAGGGPLLVFGGEPREVWAESSPSTYRLQLEALVAALRTGIPPLTSGQSLIDTQRQVDQLVRACGLPSKRAVALGEGGSEGLPS